MVWIDGRDRVHVNFWRSPGPVFALDHKQRNLSTAFVMEFATVRLSVRPSLRPYH